MTQSPADGRPIPPRPLHYTGAPLDRAHLERVDAAALLAEPEVRVVPLWRGRHAVAADGATPLWRVRASDPAAAIFLGRDDAGRPWFAEDLSACAPADPEDKERGPRPEGLGLPPDARWRDLRAFGVTLPAAEAAVLVYARGMVLWHASHRFCGRCGARTESRKAGHLRTCTGPDCGAPGFPRTDPAVIMLVTDGDRCLLGRQPNWPEGMVSTLAGFVEPGETLEEAVAREVAEETGIAVGAVTYGGSQPWPFPASLMVGFWAEAATTDIHIDREELEHAFWASRTALADFGEVGDGRPGWKLPRRDSISRWLIETWRAAG